MAEYWKSTPKYWCKFCKVFVRDTAFEKRQHEATGRHQGAIQRSLRDIHKGKDREERERQKAKEEIARLNGVVPEAGASSKGDSWKQTAYGREGAPGLAKQQKGVTDEERKRRVEQLAQLGVAVPEEYRKEMAMVGRWERVSERQINSAQEEGTPSVGVRNRRQPEEEEDEAEETTRKRGWGSTTKTYPGSKRDIDDDLEALLDAGASKRVKKEEPADEPTIKKEETNDEVAPAPTAGDSQTAENPAKQDDIPLKREESDAEASRLPLGDQDERKAEVPSAGAGIVFKKRKNKPTRPR